MSLEPPEPDATGCFHCLWIFAAALMGWLAFMIWCDS